MALLIDEVRSGTAPGRLSDDLAAAVVIKADNVAEYYYMGTDQEEWDGESFPNVAPPFPLAWFEWRNPGSSNSNGVIKPLPGGGARMGVVIKSRLVDGTIEMQTPPRWLCVAYIYYQQHGATIPLGGIEWGVNEHGGLSLFPTPEGPRYAVVPNPQLMGVDVFKEHMKHAGGMLHVPFLAMSFMHCKNVKVLEGPAIPQALQRARERKDKLPLRRYHTLMIEPVRKVVREANGGSHDGLSPKALHIARGHFKDFREHGLFGRHKGTYWWGMQLRGNAGAGEVVKDYQVGGWK